MSDPVNSGGSLRGGISPGDISTHLRNDTMQQQICQGTDLDAKTFSTSSNVLSCGHKYDTTTSGAAGTS